MEKTPPPPGRYPPPFYRFASVLVRFVLHTFFGFRVTGRINVPPTGPCVVGVNHISAWDPPVMGVATPREIHFMAKKELFEGWFMRRLIRGLRVFPVDRTRNDVGAVKEALRRMERGHAIGIFFEGTRHTDLKAAHLGAAFLAQRAGAPLVPAAIWREGRRFHVAFGPPLHAAGRSREDAADLTARLAAAVAELIPPGTDMNASGVRA